MPGRASFLLPDRALPENEINRNQVLRTTGGVRETASALSDEIAAKLSSVALLCTSKVDLQGAVGHITQFLCELHHDGCPQRLLWPFDRGSASPVPGAADAAIAKTE